MSDASYIDVHVPMGKSWIRLRLEPTGRALTRDDIEFVITLLRMCLERMEAPRTEAT